MRRADREAAYTEFVAGRQNHLRRVAYALCGDWHQADDLLQTALVKLYVAWPRVHGRDGGPEAYVRRILVNANIDEHRRPWRRERPGIDGIDPHARADLPWEERSALLEALQRLPLMQRRTVVMRHWLGFSVAETAAELGISAGTVKSHTSRAISALLQSLTPEPEGH